MTNKTTTTRIDSNVDVSPERVGQMLARPDSFLAPDDNRLFVTWSMGPGVLTRDSSLLEQANWNALKKHLNSDMSLADDWYIAHCSHWAVGWVDHLAFKVLEPVVLTEEQVAMAMEARRLSSVLDEHDERLHSIVDHIRQKRDELQRQLDDDVTLASVSGYPGMRVTRICRVLEDWFQGLAEYPCADDSELSRLEYEGMLDFIRGEAKTLAIGKLPDKWEERLFTWLWDNRQDKMNMGDSWIDDEYLAEACKALGYNDPDDES